LVEKLRRNQPNKNGREPKTLTKKGTLVHRGLLGFGISRSLWHRWRMQPLQSMRWFNGRYPVPIDF
jgi:hypothetical protein